MTSSLVGSEMCIRDRKKPTKPIPPSSIIHDVRVCEDSGRKMKRKLKSVSYTHLTLPTICSV
eukprot:6151567-Prorocentrum_lima.AAC.1